MRVLNGIMILVFLLSAGVQWNDPDPWLWVGYYFVAAAFSVFAFCNRYTPWAALAAVGFLAGFVYYTPGWNLDTLFLLREPKMESKPNVEEAREAFGLVICAAWMGVLTYAALRRRKQQIVPTECQPEKPEVQQTEN